MTLIDIMLVVIASLWILTIASVGIGTWTHDGWGCLGFVVFVASIPAAILWAGVSYTTCIILWLFLLAVLTALIARLVEVRGRKKSRRGDTRVLASLGSALLAVVLWLREYGGTSWNWAIKHWAWILVSVAVLALAALCWFLLVLQKRRALEAARQAHAVYLSSIQQERDAQALREQDARRREEHERHRLLREHELEESDRKREREREELDRKREREREEARQDREYWQQYREIASQLDDKWSLVMRARDAATACPKEELIARTDDFLTQLYRKSAGMIGQPVRLQDVAGNDQTQLAEALFTSLRLHRQGYVKVHSPHLPDSARPYLTSEDNPDRHARSTLGSQPILPRIDVREDEMPILEPYHKTPPTRPAQADKSVFRRHLTRNNSGHPHASCRTLWCEHISVTEKGVALLVQYRDNSATQFIEEMIVQGDNFSNIGAGANIQNRINKSTLTTSVGSARDLAGEETAAALMRLSEIIEAAGSEEATERFNRLTEELDRPRPEKGVLKLFWQGITEALPGVSGLIEIGEKLAKLFV
ncbi:hypothetical protein [Nonomuraea jabiensis]|uniref:Uncharacterized protein n=1 Tax=Nonomuraea jabiensis TaxID=882448 RepID=A0A7W9G919_9ACTN|nr:hypothetical protein [Nonomuraea jabiensis]MBB5779378.1 hypothetical protein [Nonomuraea jabiensis]